LGLRGVNASKIGTYGGIPREGGTKGRTEEQKGGHW